MRFCFLLLPLPRPRLLLQLLLLVLLLLAPFAFAIERSCTGGTLPINGLIEDTELVLDAADGCKITIIDSNIRLVKFKGTGPLDNIEFSVRNLVCGSTPFATKNEITRMQSSTNGCILFNVRLTDATVDIAGVTMHFRKVGAGAVTWASVQFQNFDFSFKKLKITQLRADGLWLAGVFSLISLDSDGKFLGASGAGAESQIEISNNLIDNFVMEDYLPNDNTKVNILRISGLVSGFGVFEFSFNRIATMEWRLRDGTGNLEIILYHNAYARMGSGGGLAQMGKCRFRHNEILNATTIGSATKKNVQLTLFKLDFMIENFLGGGGLFIEDNHMAGLDGSAVNDFNVHAIVFQSYVRGFSDDVLVIRNVSVVGGNIKTNSRSGPTTFLMSIVRFVGGFFSVEEPTKEFRFEQLRLVGFSLEVIDIARTCYPTFVVVSIVAEFSGIDSINVIDCELAPASVTTTGDKLRAGCSFEIFRLDAAYSGLRMELGSVTVLRNSLSGSVELAPIGVSGIASSALRILNLDGTQDSVLQLAEILLIGNKIQMSISAPTLSVSILRIDISMNTTASSSLLLVAAVDNHIVPVKLLMSYLNSFSGKTVSVLRFDRGPVAAAFSPRIINSTVVLRERQCRGSSTVQVFLFLFDVSLFSNAVTAANISNNQILFLPAPVGDDASYRMCKSFHVSFFSSSCTACTFSNGLSVKNNKIVATQGLRGSGGSSMLMLRCVDLVGGTVTGDLVVAGVEVRVAGNVTARELQVFAVHAASTGSLRVEGDIVVRDYRVLLLGRRILVSRRLLLSGLRFESGSQSHLSGSIEATDVEVDIGTLTGGSSAGDISLIYFESRSASRSSSPLALHLLTLARFTIKVASLSSGHDFSIFGVVAQDGCVPVVQSLINISDGVVDVGVNDVKSRALYVWLLLFGDTRLGGGANVTDGIRVSRVAVQVSGQETAGRVGRLEAGVVLSYGPIQFQFQQQAQQARPAGISLDQCSVEARSLTASFITAVPFLLQCMTVCGEILSSASEQQWPLLSIINTTVTQSLVSSGPNFAGIFLPLETRGHTIQLRGLVFENCTIFVERSQMTSLQMFIFSEAAGASPAQAQQQRCVTVAGSGGVVLRGSKLTATRCFVYTQTGVPPSAEFAVFRLTHKAGILAGSVHVSDAQISVALTPLYIGSAVPPAGAAPSIITVAQIVAFGFGRVAVADSITIEQASLTTIAGGGFACVQSTQILSMWAPPPPPPNETRTGVVAIRIRDSRLRLTRVPDSAVDPRYPFNGTAVSLSVAALLARFAAVEETIAVGAVEISNVSVEVDLPTEETEQQYFLNTIAVIIIEPQLQQQDGSTNSSVLLPAALAPAMQINVTDCRVMLSAAVAAAVCPQQGVCAVVSLAEMAQLAARGFLLRAARIDIVPRTTTTTSSSSSSSSSPAALAAAQKLHQLASIVHLAGGSLRDAAGTSALFEIQDVFVGFISKPRQLIAFGPASSSSSFSLNQTRWHFLCMTARGGRNVFAELQRSVVGGGGGSAAASNITKSDCASVTASLSQDTRSLSGATKTATRNQTRSNDDSDSRSDTRSGETRTEVSPNRTISLSDSNSLEPTQSPDAPKIKSFFATNGLIPTIFSISTMLGGATAGGGLSRQRKLLRMSQGCSLEGGRREKPDGASSPLQLAIDEGAGDDLHFVRGIAVGVPLFLAAYGALFAFLAYLLSHAKKGMSYDRAKRMVRFPGVIMLPAAVLMPEVASAVGTLSFFSSYRVSDIISILVGISFGIVLPVFYLISKAHHVVVESRDEGSKLKLEEIPGYDKPLVCASQPQLEAQIEERREVVRLLTARSSRGGNSSSSSDGDDEDEAADGGEEEDDDGFKIPWIVARFKSYMMDGVSQRWTATRHMQAHAVLFEPARLVHFCSMDVVVSVILGMLGGMVDGDADTQLCVTASILAIAILSLYLVLLVGAQLRGYPSWLTRYDTICVWGNVLLSLPTSVLSFLQHSHAADRNELAEIKAYLAAKAEGADAAAATELATPKPSFDYETGLEIFAVCSAVLGFFAMIALVDIILIFREGATEAAEACCEKNPEEDGGAEQEEEERGETAAAAVATEVDSGGQRERPQPRQRRRRAANQLPRVEQGNGAEEEMSEALLSPSHNQPPAGRRPATSVRRGSSSTSNKRRRVTSSAAAASSTADESSPTLQARWGNLFDDVPEQLVVSPTAFSTPASGSEVGEEDDHPQPEEQQQEFMTSDEIARLQ